jgi:hypothetical protein
MTPVPDPRYPPEQPPRKLTRGPIVEVARLRPRRRLCWRKCLVLAFTVGFWALTGWGIAYLLAGRS